MFLCNETQNIPLVTLMATFIVVDVLVDLYLYIYIYIYQDTGVQESQDGARLVRSRVECWARIVVTATGLFQGWLLSSGG